MRFYALPEKIFVWIGMAGTSTSLILELINRYAAAIVALLTVGILLPKFLLAVPRTVAIFRAGWRAHFDAARERLNKGRDADDGGSDR